jgi:hypothetical protein
METEAGSAPADHGFGIRQDQDIRPAGPTLARVPSRIVCPRGSIFAAAVSVSAGDLLSEGEDFESNITSTAKEDPDGHKEREEDTEQETSFNTP